MKKLNDDTFSKTDYRQMDDRGISREHVFRQLEMYSRGTPSLRLRRPATVGDGIRRFTEKEKAHYIDVFGKSAKTLRAIKFVPASGAATRMFKTLLQFYFEEKDLNETGREYLMEFMEGLKQERFAFFSDLREIMAGKNLDIRSLLGEGRFQPVLHYLLTSDGLNYAYLPKALLKFHRYPGDARTCLEEHLVEAGVYTKDGQQTSRVHFTLSPEYKDMAGHFLERIVPSYSRRYGAFKIDLSHQSASTDTIAVGAYGLPFRDPKGRIVFRPGGHGALIHNLNQVDADIVFIKNIDNVVPDHLKAETFTYKKVLAGFLVDLQTRMYQYLRCLNTEKVGCTELREIAGFAARHLHLDFPDDFFTWTYDKQAEFCIQRLNRPIRVCGMVKNEGQPGGGPFWVEDEDSLDTLQIVEKVQVDTRSVEQTNILEASTHFNPVDLVCGIKDFQGRKFDLLAYIDPDTYFISEKSIQGQPLKALELPGLWNGAMSRWITLFVEVPLTTFSPVKTVNDLLLPEHQPI